MASRWQQNIQVSTMQLSQTLSSKNVFKMKWQSTPIFANHVSDKSVMSCRYKELLQLSNKKMIFKIEQRIWIKIPLKINRWSGCSDTCLTSSVSSPNRRWGESVSNQVFAQHALGLGLDPQHHKNKTNAHSKVWVYTHNGKEVRQEHGLTRRWRDWYSCVAGGNVRCCIFVKQFLKC